MFAFADGKEGREEPSKPSDIRCELYVRSGVCPARLESCFGPAFFTMSPFLPFEW